MRAISGTLEAAQETMGQPYIYLLFTSPDGGTTYDYSSSIGRILSIEHHEEAYNDYATVILRNEDRSIPDLTGYWTEIGYGYVTGAGNEHSQTSRLWVKHQRHVSYMGVLHAQLELEGMWNVLREQLLRVGNPPYYSDEDEELADLTVYGIISRVLTEVGFTLDALGTEDDSIVDSYAPKFAPNDQPFESCAAVLYRLIQMTKCYIRSKTSKAMKIVYPEVTDTPDVTYYSDRAYWFWEYMERTNLLIPNHVIVFCNRGEDGLWTNIITGEASDAAEIAKYMDVTALTTAALIDSQTDATNRAAALLSRARAETLAGRVYIPHDCRVELYDKIKVYDLR